MHVEEIRESVVHHCHVTVTLSRCLQLVPHDLRVVGGGGATDQLSALAGNVESREPSADLL